MDDYAELWNTVAASCREAQDLGRAVEAVVVRLTLRKFLVAGEVAALHVRHLLYVVAEERRRERATEREGKQAREWCGVVWGGVGSETVCKRGGG